MLIKMKISFVIVLISSFSSLSHAIRCRHLPDPQYPMKALEYTPFTREEVDELTALSKLKTSQLQAALEKKSAPNLLTLAIRSYLFSTFSRWTFWIGQMHRDLIKERGWKISIFSKLIKVSLKDYDALNLLPDLRGLDKKIIKHMAQHLTPSQRIEVAKIFFNETADLRFLIEDEDVDAILDLQTNKLYRDEQSSKPEITSHFTYWAGPPDAILTPYVSISKILRYFDPKPGETIMDLGASVGRPGLVSGFLYPSVNFISFEFLKNRANEGARVIQALGLSSHVQMLNQDLNDSHVDLSKGDHFFIYNGFPPELENKIMASLQSVAKTKRIKVLHWQKAMSAQDFQTRYPWLKQSSPYFEDSIYHRFAVYESIP